MFQTLSAITWLLHTKPRTVSFVVLEVTSVFQNNLPHFIMEECHTHPGKVDDIYFPLTNIVFFLNVCVWFN